MITEQEAREAAERLIGKDRLPEDYWSQHDHDEYNLAVFVRGELARREAELVERAKPIGAEWCLANGACDDHFYMRFPVGELPILWHKASGVTRLNGTPLGVHKARGQLLDLLAALRGTERPA